MVDRNAVVDGPLVDGARTVEAASIRLKDRVVGGAQEGLETSRNFVVENPVKSVLIAAGVGALLGYLLARRSS